MVLEGVLRPHGTDAAVPAGLGLYRALVDAGHRVHILTEFLDRVTRDWLRVSVPPGYLTLTQIDPADIMEGVLRRSLGRLRATGALDLVIDADPKRLADAFHRGYTVMPLLAPPFVLPAWRPDHAAGATAWDELETEVQRQRELDTRRREKTGDE